jgi:hypothetical protein
MGGTWSFSEDPPGMLLYSLLLVWLFTINQVPHAFQQLLSAEKTPSLGDAIPAYEAMTRAWQEHQEKFPGTYDIVQKGLDKFEEYFERAEMVPANVLAMCKHTFWCRDVVHLQ